MHRKGIADKKLIQACPWLEFKVGDKIFISHQDYRRYSHAVIRYAIELIVRVAVYFGKSRDDFKDQLENKEAG